ncbi:MAG: dCTP deaminase, partial [Planctomycetota bacterium]
MILTGSQIRERLDSDIIIDPFEESQLNPNSYNLRLHK